MRTLFDELPAEHKALTAEHEVWSYRVSSPLSLDDAPEVLVTVHYGRTESVCKRVYTLQVVS